MGIDLKNTHAALPHVLGEAGLDPGDDRGTEMAGEPLPCEDVIHTHQAGQQLVGVPHTQAHLSAGADLDGKAEFPIVKDTTPNMTNPRLYIISHNKMQG